MNNNNRNRDVIDDDLYEELDEEKLYELVEQERQKALTRAQNKKTPKPRRRFPKWLFWLIAAVMVLNVVSLIPRTFSIPAIDFLITSAKLSTQENIQHYKEAVVVIETDDGRGTGFSISADGTIITNHHVVEGEDSVTVAFPEKGLFAGDVVETYPSVDLAVLNVSGDTLPHLKLADEATFEPGSEQVYFIGNPTNFNGIANEGRIIGDIRLNGWDKPVIMMEAPVFRGNSGSPVINEDGSVIGIVFATLHHDTHGRVGLFIPIDYYYSH
ncbi:Trypsin-like peptidase domain-containing protein [Lentibacillus halodurans]|uniref:Trypsin-like peptidase domain-containing protein n=1 Tax=Lentibacillus halodurans TaxID=237679 RepID=A0A1I0VWI7_9BACI|nr:serine protease [Lentibacillus halodurans]SFA80741.1 Trypsin-like peptidase domain-containing protein [Lentibacillus halodurans]